MSRPVRVLLVWPGSDGAAAGNFGMPQLVLMGTVAQARTNAVVHLRDLVVERSIGVAFPQLVDGPDGEGYDVIGFSVYSSFDHLKCQALAEIARQRWPDAVIVAGGYHASARPLEYVCDGSPFDICVVGEGETPLVRIIESVEGGAPLRNVVLGPEAVDHLDDLPPSDWSLLSRYQGFARKIASQAQVYLSRGCPFDCAFCMERAKREVSWRGLSVERAIEEIEGLHRFLDLRGWTLYFGDALFGMKKSWRRAFLAELARRDIPVDKYWLLIRVDLVDDEDLALFGAANCGLGFGLESGDPGLLATIRKSGRLEDYLDRMDHVAAKARETGVPWGANVICGHPGETAATLATSAKYLEKLFLGPHGTTGFLSVDPFRLYPGSPIDADRGHYERTYGTKFHYPHWWDDGDPEFLSEWVDPSAELDWIGREDLQHRLLGPILAGIEDKFVYGGKAREYFLRAIREQVDFAGPRGRMPYFGRYYAWQRWLGHRTRGERHRQGHAALGEVAAIVRARALPGVARAAGVAMDDPVIAAIAKVPRERFVPLDAVEQSVRDVAIALDDSGLATVSAMHAYARAHRLLDVQPGDRVLDLGAGTGYGAAILRELVGDAGDVVAIEIDPALVDRTPRELVVNVAGDAIDPASWPAAARDCTKVVVGFALDAWPAAWLDAFASGTVVVAPVHGDDGLRLTRAVHDGDRFVEDRFEEVLYVPTRRAADLPRRAEPVAPPAPVERREPARLPVVR